MNIEIDYDKCIKCGLCSKVCGSSSIEIDAAADGRPIQKYPLICNDCGHCVAVCPVNAVVNKRMDMSQFKDIADPEIEYEQYLKLVRNRRSIRIFKDRPLTDEHIEKLLGSVRYIPTGSNEQSLKYMIITNPEKLEEIKEFMARKFRLATNLVKTLGRLFVSKDDRESLGRHDELLEKGEDPYLRGAPCLLVIYADQSYFGITAWDAGIASYNLDLAAQTLGIGAMMNGFFVVVSKLFGKLKRIAQVPKGHKVYAAMVLGYPNINYKRTIARLPLDARKI